MSLRSTTINTWGKPHIFINDSGFLEVKPYIIKSYNNEMAVQFCYEQNKKRNLDKNK